MCDGSELLANSGGFETAVVACGGATTAVGRFSPMAVVVACAVMGGGREQQIVAAQITRRQKRERSQLQRILVRIFLNAWTIGSV